MQLPHGKTWCGNFTLFVVSSLYFKNIFGEKDLKVYIAGKKANRHAFDIQGSSYKSVFNVEMKWNGM